MWKFLRNGANHVFGCIVGTVAYALSSVVLAPWSVGAKVFGDYVLELRDFWRSNVPMALFLGAAVYGVLAIGTFVVKTLFEIGALILKGFYQGAKDGLSHLGTHLKEDWHVSEDTPEAYLGTRSFYEYSASPRSSDDSDVPEIDFSEADSPEADSPEADSRDIDFSAPPSVPDFTLLQRLRASGTGMTDTPEETTHQQKPTQLRR